jgi:prepilin-type N-terminal cleavage/methylation domain-containing protein
LTGPPADGIVAAMCRGLRDERGVTLAEILVVTAVLGLLMAGLLGLLQVGVRSYTWGAARVEAQQSARVALERAAKELRDAGYDPTGAGLAAVLVAEPERVVFQRDLNGNGVIDPTSERVTILRRAGEPILRREAGGGAQPLVEGVRRFRLEYFDRRRLPTADPARVALVRMTIETGGTGAGPAVVMETEVALRNRLP